MDEGSFPLAIGRTNRHARALRRDATDVEARLWQHLRSRQLGGHKFRRQATVSHYVADFLCVEKRLVVELDGGQHSAAVDQDRTARLEHVGQVRRLGRFSLFGGLERDLLAAGCIDGAPCWYTGDDGLLDRGAEVAGAVKHDAPAAPGGGVGFTLTVVVPMGM